MDVTGKVIVEKPVDLATDHVVDVARLEPGYYTIVVHSLNANHTAKFVKVL